MDALAIVKRWWRNTKDLPFPLDMLCQGAMVAGPVLLVFLVLPIVEWTVNGRQMSYAELWKSGAGLAGTIIFLSAAEIISLGVTMLMLVALVGMYVGFGILIAVYRLINKLE